MLAGVRVRTTDGQDLGKFEAFYFDKKSGRLEAGKDVAFVSPEAADTLQDLEEALKRSW